MSGAKSRSEAHHRHGNIDYWIGKNAIGPIFVDGRELIRRLFVTVRDSSWIEVEPETDTLEADPAQPGRLWISGEHRNRDIHFAWTGQFWLDPEQCELSFSIEGEVLGDGAVSRLGLIVLLPPERVEGASGSIVAGKLRVPVAFDIGLGPQPIVNGLPTGLTEPFDTIELTGRDGGRIALGFEGELFEIEDQRNWGDASFKIYCTPLARGFPRSVHKGERIAHRVRLCYALPPPARGVRSPQICDARPFPALGAAVGALGATAGWMPWSHVAARPDEIDQGEFPGGTDFELVLEHADFADGWARVARVLDRARERIRRICIAGKGVALPEEKALVELRALAGASGIPIFAATRGWFVELNRNVALPAGYDGFAWPVTPTVHSRSTATMLENAAPFTPMAAHLRARGGTRLVIADLAWGSAGSAGPATAGRNDLLVWLAAALFDAAAAGVESVTLGTDVVAHLAGAPETRAALARLVALAETSVRPIATCVAGLSALLVIGEREDDLLVANSGRGVASLALSAGGEGGALQNFDVLPRSFAARAYSEINARDALDGELA